MIDPARLGWFWGFLPGPREWALLAVLVVVLYGRSETVRRGVVRLARPWKTRGGSPRSDWPLDRWPLVVTAIASAIVAAWVVTWITVALRQPGP